MDITKAKDILDYWLPKDGSADFDKWFMKSSDYDEEIKEKFGDLLIEAEKGKGYGWLISKNSFVAYIILIDQFSRHIYRDTENAFKNDNGVMIFTELGFELYREDLEGYEFMFAFMPYMHTESLQYQEKGKILFDYQMKLYTQEQHENVKSRKNLLESSIDTEFNLAQKEVKMLEQMKSHVDGHYKVIKMYGRFPKRNQALDRDSSFHEMQYMNRDEVKKRPY